MIELQSVEKINSLKQGIEATTGETYADLTEAVQDLKDGYGQGGGTDTRMKELIEGTLTELYDDTATSVGDYAFAGKKKIKNITITNATRIYRNAFDGCEAETITLPNAEVIEGDSFYNADKLLRLELPLVTTVDKTKYDATPIGSCDALLYVDLPSITGFLSKSIVTNCKKLKAINLGNPSSFYSGCFSGNCSLVALVIRNTDKICSMSTNASSMFSSCYHILGTVNTTYNPDGLKDGYFYVPRAFLSDDDEKKDYRRATNWVTYEGQFRAIEDYTVDGTIDGEMDWAKMGVTIE